MNGDINIRHHDASSQYKIILIILSIVIVGLVTGIIISSNLINNTDNNLADDIMPGTAIVSELTPEDEVSDKVSTMFEDPSIDNSKIEDYYDEVIKKAIDEENFLFAMNITVQKASFIAIEEEDCERAQSYADNLDISVYPEEDLAYLQSHIHSAICPNDEESEL